MGQCCRVRCRRCKRHGVHARRTCCQERGPVACNQSIGYLGTCDRVGAARGHRPVHHAVAQDSQGCDSEGVGVAGWQALGCPAHDCVLGVGDLDDAIARTPTIALCCAAQSRGSVRMCASGRGWQTPACLSFPSSGFVFNTSTHVTANSPPEPPNGIQRCRRGSRCQGHPWACATRRRRWLCPEQCMCCGT